MGEAVLQKVERGVDVIAAKSEILQEKCEHGIQFLQEKSDAVDLAATSALQKSEEFFVGRSKHVSDSVQQNSKKVSGAVQQNSKKLSEYLQKSAQMQRALLPREWHHLLLVRLKPLRIP